MFDDNEEFTRLWTKAQPVVAGFIRAAAGNRPESDDLLQDVDVVVLRKFRTYDRSQPFVGWAIGIARYQILAYHRRCALDRLVFDSETSQQIAAAYQRVSNELGDMGEASPDGQHQYKAHISETQNGVTRTLSRNEWNAGGRGNGGAFFAFVGRHGPIADTPMLKLSTSVTQIKEGATFKVTMHRLGTSQSAVAVKPILGGTAAKHTQLEAAENQRLVSRGSARLYPITQRSLK